MLTLALDTALTSCSAAILNGETVLAREILPLEKGHAEYLPPMIASVLKAADARPANLDRVGVTIGPGGFAGVRVGLSFARNFCLGLKAKCIGLTTLEVFAEQARAERDGPTLIAAIVDARRGQVYAGLYDQARAALLAPFVDDPNAALMRLEAAATGRAVIAVGNGVRVLVDHKLIPPANWRVNDEMSAIDPSVLARLAANAAAPDGPPTPLYLRPPDAAPARPSLFAGLMSPAAGTPDALYAE